MSYGDIAFAGLLVISFAEGYMLGEIRALRRVRDEQKAHADACLALAETASAALRDAIELRLRASPATPDEASR